MNAAIAFVIVMTKGSSATSAYSQVPSNSRVAKGVDMCNKGKSFGYHKSRQKRHTFLSKKLGFTSQSQRRVSHW